MDSHKQPEQPALNGSGLTTDSLLAVDLGSVTTRTTLFDMANGVFRFVASGSAPTTIDPPFANVSEGLRNALDDLTAITGRAFVDDDEMLISPARSDGAGVDRLAATASAGPPLKTVILGLLPDASLESARRAAASSYLQVLDVIGLGDRRRQEQQVDSILRAKPDLVIIAGGADGGSAGAVLRLAETVNVACRLMETGRQPRVLFAGNAALRDEVTRLLRGRAEVVTAGNVRPALDLEDIVPARHALTTVYEAQRQAAYAGFAEVARWASGGAGLRPTATALGRLAQFISSQASGSPARPALVVDVGSANVVAAAAQNGRLWLNVQTETGVGHSAQRVLERAGAAEIMRWLPNETPPAALREYAWHKSLYPATIPQEARELLLEHALARAALRLAVNQARAGWPAGWRGAARGALPFFDPILACGAVLAGAPRAAQAALIVLDALEPAGIFTLLLDANAIAPALGAAAAVQPLAVAQVWGSSAVQRLGTVIAPIGPAARAGQPGAVAVRVKVTGGGGETAEVEVAAGAVQAIPLAARVGQTATVAVQPARGFDVGRGPGRGVVLRDLRGSALGLIVDARGRPLVQPRDPAARREAMQKWLWGMGA